MASERPEPTGMPAIAGCPWCGPGTDLILVGDGMGNVAVSCRMCQCRGPVAPIQADFEDADLMTVGKWSQRAPMRPPLSHSALEMFRTAKQMHVAMNGYLDEASTIEIPYALVRDILADHDR